MSFDSSAINTTNSKNLITLFIDSILIVSVASIFAMLIGSSLAYVLATVQIRYSLILVVLLISNFFIPSYIHALSWSRLFMDGSFLFLVFDYLWGYSGDAVTVGGWFGTVWVLALSYFPIVFVVVYFSCFAWKRNMQSAALLLGSPWKEFKIKLRFLTIPVIVSTLLVFLLVFSDFGVPDLFQIPMYSTEIFIQLSSYYNNSKSLFISLPFIVLSFIVLWIIIKLSNKLSLSVPSAKMRAVKIQLNRSRSFVLHVLLYAVVLFLIILPLFNLLYLTSSLDTLVQAFELVKMDLLNSVVFSIIVSVIIITLTFYASYGYVRMRTRFKEGARAIILLMLMLPASLIALSLISFWNQDGLMGWFYQSEGIVVLGVSMRWLPVAFELLLLGWLFVNEKQENSALLFGKSWWSVVKNVHIPVMKPFILAVFVLCFILAFNELTMMVLLSPPGMTLLPSRIFSVIHYGPDNLLAAICVIQVLTIFAFISFIAWSNRRLLSFYNGV